MNPDVISSPINLRIVTSEYNHEKRAKSDMPIEELYRLHELFMQEILKD